MVDASSALLPGAMTMVGAAGGFVFGRVTEIAGERRSSYAAIAVRLLELWRGSRPTRLEELRSELLRLVFSNDPDLFSPIDVLTDALIAGAADSVDRLVDLMEVMRRTSVLGNVKYRYLGGGPSQRALIDKLMKSDFA